MATAKQKRVTINKAARQLFDRKIGGKISRVEVWSHWDKKGFEGFNLVGVDVHSVDLADQFPLSQIPLKELEANKVVLDLAVYYDRGDEFENYTAIIKGDEVTVVDDRWSKFV